MQKKKLVNLQLLPTFAAVEGVVFAPSFAVAEPVSFPSAADSTMIAGMSSCNHFQCLDLSKNWSLEWGQLPGLPQSVVPETEEMAREGWK